MTEHNSSAAARAGKLAVLAASTALMALSVGAASAAPAFLDTIKRQTTLTSTVPENGDQNPYAIVVAPVSAGAIA